LEYDELLHYLYLGLNCSCTGYCVWQHFDGTTTTQQGDNNYNKYCSRRLVIYALGLCEISWFDCSWAFGHTCDYCKMAGRRMMIDSVDDAWKTRKRDDDSSWYDGNLWDGLMEIYKGEVMK